MYQRGISHSDKADLDAKQKFANTNGTLKLNVTNGTIFVSTRVLYDDDIILVELIYTNYIPIYVYSISTTPISTLTTVVDSKECWEIAVKK